LNINSFVIMKCLMLKRILFGEEHRRRTGTGGGIDEDL
jgi:hypothetical protein